MCQLQVASRSSEQPRCPGRFWCCSRSSPRAVVVEGIDDKFFGLAVRIPDGWVLATRASLTWVDHLGQPTAGPYAIPDGVLGPGGWSLAERDGIAFVSGGGPEPGSSARVVALDRAGNVSAPYALPGVDASLARSGDRLVAVYGHLEPDPDQPGWGRAVVGTTELTCASAAPPGPPSRLSPPSARPVRHRPPPYSR